MGRKTRLKKVNNIQQKLSRGLRHIYGDERVKKIQEAEAAFNNNFINLKNRLKADASYADYPNVNAELQSTVDDLQEFLTAGEIGSQGELIRLGRQFAAALAETDETTQLRLRGFQQEYAELTKRIASAKQEIDALPYAASYIDWQRLASWQKPSLELDQGFAQSVVAANEALSKLDAAYRPAAFKPVQALPAAVPAGGWEENLKSLHASIAKFESRVKGSANDKLVAAIDSIDAVEEGNNDFSQIIAKMEAEQEAAIQAVDASDAKAEDQDKAKKPVAAGEAEEKDKDKEKDKKPAAAVEDKEAKKEKIRQEWAPKIAAVREEQNNFAALKTAWQNYRGKDFAAMKVAADGDLFPKEIADSAKQFAQPVEYKDVSQELLALKQQIQNVENTADRQKAESDIAQLAMQVASNPNGNIAKLLAAPGVAGSPSAKYAKEIQAYCGQFISPMYLVQHCAKTQQTFKEHYEAIAADLQTHQFHDDQSYQAAVTQRLKDHRHAVEADLRVLDLDLENRPTDDPLKPKIKEARTALEAEVKKCDDLFKQQRTKINEANDKLELQILTWSAQNINSLVTVYKAAYKEQHPNATKKECESEVAKYAKQQTELRANFAAGRGIDPDVLRRIKQIDINKEFASMYSLELGNLPEPGSVTGFLRNKLGLKFGGITVEMKVTKAGQPLSGKRESAKQDTYDSSTFYIKINDKNPTPESKQALGRFFKLLAAQGRKPPSKPVGKVVLSRIKPPPFLIKISDKAIRDQYYLDRALYYAKIARDNKVPFEVTDPVFAPGTDLRKKLEETMKVYQSEHNEAVDQYAGQLSQAVVDKNITINEKGTLTGKHGVTHELPKVLEAKGFNEVAQFVAHHAALGTMVALTAKKLQDSGNDFLKKSSAQLAEEQAPSDTQKFKGEIEEALKELNSVVRKIEAFEDGHPDTDLTNVVLVAQEQWVHLQLAREMLAPEDRTLLNAGDLHRLGEKLFQGPSAGVEKQLALEETCLKMFKNQPADIRPLVLLIKGTDPSKQAVNIKAALAGLAAGIPQRIPVALEQAAAKQNVDKLPSATVQAVRTRLAKDYCDVLLEHASVKKAAPPSSFQRQAIDSNKLSPTEFAAAAQAYFARLEASYKDAIDSAGGNPEAKAVVEAKFTAHLAAQAGELAGITVQQSPASVTRTIQPGNGRDEQIPLLETGNSLFTPPDFSRRLQRTITEQKDSGATFKEQLTAITEELTQMTKDARAEEKKLEQEMPVDYRLSS